MTHLAPIPMRKPRLFRSGGLWIAAECYERNPLTGFIFYRPAGKGETWRDAWEDMKAREPVSLWGKMARAAGLI